MGNLYQCTGGRKGRTGEQLRGVDVAVPGDGHTVVTDESVVDLDRVPTGSNTVTFAAPGIRLLS